MNSLNLFKVLTPEIVDIIELRYSLLKAIHYCEPIGRRALSEKLDIQERTIRNEANILKEQGLIKIESTGMSITDSGLEILNELGEVYAELKGIIGLEDLLKLRLGIKNVKIVPGNADNSDICLTELSKAASKLIKSALKDDDILGITGGTTMASVAKECIPDNKLRNITIVPARGGLGKNIYTQSNSIAVNLAEKLGGNYRLLYVPDGLSEEALIHMIENGEIKETLSLIEKMNILVFGIGRADTMARRRNLSEERIDLLESKGAVAEAFGHYFDIEGNEIWEYRTIGLSLEKFRNIDTAIAVAGGEEKAEAIIAVSSLNKNIELVTDELAAKRILEILDNISNNKTKEE